MGKNLDVMPGEEFRVALQQAHAGGAQVVLGDRPLTITLARVWHALGLWEKVKLTGTLLWTGLRCAGLAGRGLGRRDHLPALPVTHWPGLRVWAVVAPLRTAPAVPPLVLDLYRRCGLCTRSLFDGDEMRAEIEKLKESDVLTQALLEFGKVCTDPGGSCC